MCVKYGAFGPSRVDDVERLGDVEVRADADDRAARRGRACARRREAARRAPGSRLQSVRYANAPSGSRGSAAGRASPGTGTTSTPPSENAPPISNSDNCGMPPPCAGCGVEDVAEHPPQIGERPQIAEDGMARPLHEVVAPHLVEAEDVIRVAVREEDGIDAADVVRERLRAKIGGRIDENVAHRSATAKAHCRHPDAAAARRRSRSGSTAASAGRADRSDRQTAQSQPMAGTPLEVPVPRSVTRIARSRACRSRLDDALAAARGLDEPQPQLVEHLLEQLALFRREVALGLHVEQREDLDHLRGALEVRLGCCAGLRDREGRRNGWRRCWRATGRRRQTSAPARTLDQALPVILSCCEVFMSTAATEFIRLVEVVARLRAPDGCPWDREQSIDSLKPFVLEETYEVLETIDRHDHAALREELGDFLYQAVFLAQLEAEAGHFTIADSIRSIADKLVRRHPHVFRRDEGEAALESADQVRTRWEEIKAQERGAQNEAADAARRRSRRRCRRCLRAYHIGVRAASVGFDWTRAADVVDKIQEEVDELREVVAGRPADRPRPRGGGDGRSAVLDREPRPATRDRTRDRAAQSERQVHTPLRSDGTVDRPGRPGDGGHEPGGTGTGVATSQVSATSWLTRFAHHEGTKATNNS